MRSCDHTGWLSVARRDHDLVLKVSDTAKRLLNDNWLSSEDPPSLFVVIGNQTKIELLQELGAGTGVRTYRGRRCHGEIHLFRSLNQRQLGRPLLIADGDVPQHNRLTTASKLYRCHEVTAHTLAAEASKRPSDVGDQIYCRMLYPFADVMIFLSDDLGGIEHVARRVAAWLDRGQSTTIQIRPWLFVIVEDIAEDEARSQFESCMRRETRLDILDRFQGVRFANLPSHPRRRPRHRGSPWADIVRTIASQSELVRAERLNASCLFSPRHLTSLLHSVAEHAAKAPREPFDMISASRLNNPPADDLTAHVSSFLECFTTLHSLQSAAIPMLASSLILDHYPPEMHRFNPQDVFRTLYRTTCCHVARTSVLSHQRSSELILPSTFADMVESEMVKLFRRYVELGSSRALHLEVMGSCRDLLGTLTSARTCTICLRRKPQYDVGCGHYVCQNCVRIFGSRDKDDTSLYRVEQCPLCQVDGLDLIVRIMPQTASVRVLSIDGGGTRGRAPLECLQVLQEQVGLPYPVQRHFDVIYGTSSGAIITCALYMNGWPIEDCISCFNRLARLAFQPRLSFGIPFLSAFVQFILSLVKDSRYPARNLESALRQVFGTISMTRGSKAAEMGASLGVPVTTISDVSTCIFTNYNGVGHRSEESDYHILQPKSGLGEIPLYEILLCATAAPFYLSPHEIEHIGTFQDGGLTYNNPTSIAVKETAAMFPTRPEPSLVVSLGTGSSRMDEPEMSRSRGLWRDSFLVRVLRALWKCGSSERGCRQMLSRDGGFFRFDIDFNGAEPPLDSLTSLEEISQVARDTMLKSPSLEKLVRRIRAELFLFELDFDRPYRFIDGAFECFGTLRCRFRARSPEFEAFQSQLDRTSAHFHIGGRISAGSFQERSAIGEDGNFCKKISIRASSRSESFAIMLQEGIGEPCHISGSPFTLQRLLDQQDLECFFGTPDHRVAKRSISDEYCSKMVKRRRLR